MANPQLSVIIPAYNAADYIGETIRSVLDQTVSEHEIIVVDDGSTDSTAEILAGFGSRIRTIGQPNQGLSAARNSGIAVATGKWLTFLDADDLWLPDFCRVMLASAESLSEDKGVVTCGWHYVDNLGKKIGTFAASDDEETTYQKLLLGNRFPIMAAIVRASWVYRVKGFDLNINGVQDWDFWLRLASAGCNFCSVPNVLVSYRQVSDSMSRHVPMMRDNGVIVLDKIYSQSIVPPEVFALRNKAYGLVKLWAGANFYEAGNPEEGFQEIVNALVEFPALLDELETSHAIICAEQPRHSKGTAFHLDLGYSEKRLRAILNATARSSKSSSRALQRRAEMLGYLTLAQYSLRQGRRRQAIQHTIYSLSLADTLAAGSMGLRLLVKSVFLSNPAKRSR